MGIQRNHTFFKPYWEKDAPYQPYWHSLSVSVHDALHQRWDTRGMGPWLDPVLMRLCFWQWFAAMSTGGSSSQLAGVQGWAIHAFPAQVSRKALGKCHHCTSSQLSHLSEGVVALTLPALQGYLCRIWVVWEGTGSARWHCFQQSCLVATERRPWLGDSNKLWRGKGPVLLKWQGSTHLH